ncbi:MAG: hypothetical protein KAI94_04955, partial [Anaerolineales bacterium]|nr:hypothetical protein [Anaerolineales bacterium]
MAALVLLILIGGCGKGVQTAMPSVDLEEDQSASQREAVSLYVDAMMLKELNEQDKALVKLDAALALDPKFALGYSLKGDIYQMGADYEKSAA